MESFDFVFEDTGEPGDINELLNAATQADPTSHTPSLTVKSENLGLDVAEAPDTQPEVPEKGQQSKRSRAKKSPESTTEQENVKIARDIQRVSRKKIYGGYFEVSHERDEAFKLHDFVPHCPTRLILPIPYNVITLGKVPVEGPIDLETLYARCKNAELGSAHPPGLRLTLTEPRGMSAFINQNGTVRLVGANSIHAAKMGMQRVMRIIREIFNMQFTEFPFSCCNILANFDYGCPVKLSEFAREYPNACYYEPLLFCGVVVSFDNGVRALVYVSGKCSMSGAKCNHDLYLAFEALTKKIAPFFRRSTDERENNK
mmetsp:Transcript_27163/g.42277  ORF Transcript_27163/g.42277 Transcript_27163/m.42277 type:complete len:315 (-) Transcript_27163:17-961(-)